MLSFLSFFVFGRERVSQARRCRRCGKTSSIQADKQRMPLKMKATCHTCLQASLVFTNTRQQAINERQQENEEAGQKITDEYRSKNRWMEIDIEQRRSLAGSQPKQNRCRDLSSTNSGSKPKKTDIILCLLSNSAGARRGRLMKCSSQDAKVFAACELPFYKGALCAFSLVLWQL